MTTISTIISDAFRESRITAVGDGPQAEEFAEGFRRLQAILKSIMAFEAGEYYTSVNFGSDNLSTGHTAGQDWSSMIESTYLPSNSRLVCHLDHPTTIYLDPNPEDGAKVAIIDVAGNFGTNSLTLDGNGRNIDSATTAVLSTNSVNKDWFYRADLAKWVAFTDITEDGVSPLPDEFDEYLVTLLALRLNPRYTGTPMSGESGAIFQKARSYFRSRYKQTKNMPSEYGLQLSPLRGLGRRIPFSVRGLFETGRSTWI